MTLVAITTCCKLSRDWIIVLFIDLATFLKHLKHKKTLGKAIWLYFSFNAVAHHHHPIYRGSCGPVKMAGNSTSYPM